MTAKITSAPRPTEAGFLRTVIELAQLRGWRVSHQRPARTARGWRTAVQGDAGFPDLVLVRTRPSRLIFAELKVGRNRATPGQLLWLCSLASVPGNVEVVTWRPEDWPKIEETLS